MRIQSSRLWLPGRPICSIQLVDRLSRLGVWPEAQKEESQMPIIGFARMATNMNSLATTVKKGKERFKLQTIKESKSVDFELTLEFRVEQRARAYPWD